MKIILDKHNNLSILVNEIIEKELEKEPGKIGEYYLIKNYYPDFSVIKKIFQQINKGLKCPGNTPKMN